MTALTLEETQAALRARDLSPRETVAAYLAAVARWEPTTRAFVTVGGDRPDADAVPDRLDVDAVRDRLDAAAARVEERLLRGSAGPLTGIGVSVKDNIDVAGTATTAGSGWFREPAVADATCWQRASAAGALYVGKTNMHEFAYGATTVNQRARTTRNPWNPEHICGGSSGGSAASVAVGACGASLGTDTGGSVRIPAALTGVTGFKPSYGLVPATKVLPLSPSCDTVGVLSRTAAGCAEVLRVLAPSLPDRRDEPRSAELRGLRVGVIESHLDTASAAVGEVLRCALDLLERLGARLEPVTLRYEAEARAVTSTVVGFEAAQVHRRWLRSTAAEYGDDVRGRLETGLAVSATAYRAAVRDRRRLAVSLLDDQRGYDVVAGPTVGFTAPRVTDCAPDRVAPVQAGLVANTYCFNVTGQPAVSVPCGLAGDGLPVGLQLAAAPGEDRRLLDIAMALQDATDWHRAQPSAQVSTP